VGTGAVGVGYAGAGPGVLEGVHGDLARQLVRLRVDPRRLPPPPPPIPTRRSVPSCVKVTASPAPAHDATMSMSVHTHTRSKLAHTRTYAHTHTRTHAHTQQATAAQASVLPGRRLCPHLLRRAAETRVWRGGGHLDGPAAGEHGIVVLVQVLPPPATRTHPHAHTCQDSARARADSPRAGPRRACSHGSSASSQGCRLPALPTMLTVGPSALPMKRKSGRRLKLSGRRLRL
jgi:hypothetical protein